ncbi:MULTISPECIES: penicillin-binding protein PBP1A [Streptococcus]|uniref:Penicillin-binding protein PBP1A n=2 Tax=Streptococcus ruminantium TaxID=1917441 RepID=A0ABU1B4P8_9STRE|nr:MULTISPECIES: penicillin-binding protein PBP1A [Streptococcus]MDQ8760100.1 penicillin-binding protein PBP1A [Streptococcus ruminantium]MDQ8764307.1 penicillin-binding protein PBP1A [Streptococcus ruminantium]MDQ8766733.1 penicillin-binding protein PBP1A [Streptococcus ruminantium]MDQ8769326.1 penicillin-binding protein PBP1A [Streptococcus ruminantium]MDQ8775351.1 penicillin-binding protein PBP1A [Streptococcus ruminantium]
MKTTTIKKALLMTANILLAGAIIVCLAGAALVVYYIQSAPQLTEETLTATASSKIYDKNGKLIADLGSEKRSSAKTEDIPTDLVNAIVAIEDQRFFNHRGIDVIRIAGSLINNLRGRPLQGGSTLDQQFIKLTYFSTSVEDQNLKRKIQEAWLAMQLERRNTKQEILTYYINKVYMSNSNYGMRTASLAFYRKELKDLTLPQLALLAGMPQAPNQYDPYTNPADAKARRDLVLKKMLEEKYIDSARYEQAVLTPITEGLQPLLNTTAYPAYMDNYLKQVVEEVESKTGYNLLTTGMDVYTNVDPEAQQRLWNIYNTDTYVNYPDDLMQVASTVVDVSNGKVVAQLGGRKQESNVSFGLNQAVETNRDFGSTMKPITDYAPAFENGIYTSTADSILDGPYNYPSSTIPVNNWDKRYFGNISIKTAIQYSRNVPAVKALEATGLENALKFLNSIGIDYPEIHYSNAISSNTSDTSRKYGVSSEKMAAAYAAFANGGTYYAPQYVNKIVFSDGTVTEYAPKGTRVMTKETAYMMTDMMKAVLSYGYGLNASVSGVPMAGKTGTSNYTDSETDTILANTPEARNSYMVVPDENFVGYSSQYAMAVWTGYTNRMTPILDRGMRIATDVYHNMMLFMHSDYTAADWEVPSGLVRYGANYYLRGSQSLYNAYNTYTTPSTSSSSSTETTEENGTTNSSDSTAGTSTETASASNDTTTTDNNPPAEQINGQ